MTLPASGISCDACGGAYVAGRMVPVYSPKPVVREDAVPWPPGHIGNHCREWPIVCSKACIGELGPEWGPPGSLNEQDLVRMEAGLASGKLMRHAGRACEAKSVALVPEKPSVYR